MPWLRKFKKIWYLCWKEDGHTHNRRVSQSKSMAQEALDRKREELERRRAGLPQRESWIVAFVQAHLKRLEERVHAGDLRPATLSRATEAFKNLQAWLLEHHPTIRQVCQLNRRILEKYQLARVGQVKARTVNTEFTLLSPAFRQAVHDGQLKLSPLDGLRRLRERDSVPARQLSPAQVARLLAAARQEVRSYLAGYVYTGARRGELFAVEWGDVDFRQGTIRIQNLKTHSEAADRDRLLPIHPRLRRILAARRDLERPWPAMPGENLRRWLREAAQKVKIGHVRLHDLRHAFASALASEGVDLYTVATLLGHRDLASTKRYSHLAPKTLRRAVGKLRF